MASQDDGAESRAEQELALKDSRVERAEAWISQAAEEGIEEALVYLRSRGHDCDQQIEKLRKRWLADEQYCLAVFGWANPNHPLVTRTNPETLPPDSANFWDDPTERDDYIDGSMLRAAKACGIEEFDSWWPRIEIKGYQKLPDYGGSIDPWWLFNMARADLAISSGSMSLLLHRYLTAISGSPEDDHRPLIDRWSTMAFVHHRLQSNGSPVITQMLNRLFRERVDGAWCTRLYDSEASIESTAMALHALALAKPFGWKFVAELGRDWLWSQQETDGDWREGLKDPVYLTVLVLDAINLADGSGPVTFNEADHRNGTGVSPQQDRVGKKQPRSTGTAEAVNACKRYIETHGLTYTAFAEMVGISDKTLRNFFDTGKMRNTSFSEMAKRLGLTAEQLNRGESPTKRPRPAHE